MAPDIRAAGSARWDALRSRKTSSRNGRVYDFLSRHRGAVSDVSSELQNSQKLKETPAAVQQRLMTASV